MEMRERTLLIVLMVLALGLVETGLSSLYTQSTIDKLGGTIYIIRVSCGFPFIWYGYETIHQLHMFPQESLPEYWYSLELLLIDAAFWIAISSIACFVAIRAMNMSHKRKSSKLSVINI